MARKMTASTLEQKAYARGYAAGRKSNKKSGVKVIAALQRNVEYWRLRYIGLRDGVGVDDPFRGELSIYRCGEFVMGINAPFIDAALESLHAAIGNAMFSTEVEPTPAVVAVDPHVEDSGPTPTRV